MDFYQKYELIEPLAGAGTRSFRARQKATGRDVAVHLLTGGATAENEARGCGLKLYGFGRHFHRFRDRADAQCYLDIRGIAGEDRNAGQSIGLETVAFHKEAVDAGRKIDDETNSLVIR